jgi:hypothetical protein
MRKLSRSKLQFCLRAIFLGGVLSGLLFSCGEGIRLLPFPAGDGPARAAGGKWRSDRGNDYQKNIHRFENQQGNYQSKSRRSQSSDWADEAHARYLSLFFAAPDQPEIVLHNHPPVYRSRLPTKNAGSRAPPFSS